MARAAVVNVWTGTLAPGRLHDHPTAGQEPLEAGAGGHRSLRRNHRGRPAYQAEQHWSKQKILDEYSTPSTSGISPTA